MQLTTLDDVAVVLFVAVILAVLVKAFMKWVENKHMAVTPSECRANRDLCCMPELQRIVTEHLRADSGHEARIKADIASINKELEQGRENFKMLREDNKAMKTSVDRMTAVLEVYVQHMDEREQIRIQDRLQNDIEQRKHQAWTVG